MTTAEAIQKVDTIRAKIKAVRASIWKNRNQADAQKNREELLRNERNGQIKIRQ